MLLSACLLAAGELCMSPNLDRLLPLPFYHLRTRFRSLPPYSLACLLQLRCFHYRTYNRREIGKKICDRGDGRMRGFPQRVWSATSESTIHMTRLLDAGSAWFQQALKKKNQALLFFFSSFLSLICPSVFRLTLDGRYLRMRQVDEMRTKGCIWYALQRSISPDKIGQPSPQWRNKNGE